MLVVSVDLRIPHRELRFSFVASGGPGGQNVNKRSTKAVLRWNLMGSPSLSEDVRRRFLSRYRTRVTRSGVVVMSSDQHRDQTMNRNECLYKLADMLRSVESPPRIRRKTKPSHRAGERRLENKRRRSLTKLHRRRPGSLGDD